MELETKQGELCKHPLVGEYLRQRARLQKFIRSKVNNPTLGLTGVITIIHQGRNFTAHDTHINNGGLDITAENWQCIENSVDWEFVESLT